MTKDRKLSWQRIRDIARDAARNREDETRALISIERHLETIRLELARHSEE